MFASDAELDLISHLDSARLQGTNHAMPYHFRNLVFEGGGVKGIAYVGAMEVLGRRRILPDIVRVGGTSAGAINAALFALGYTNPQVRELLAGLKFRNFLDADWGVLRDSRRLLSDFGWYKGDFFRQWMAELVGRKLGNSEATFADLRAAGRPDLYVYGTNLSTGFGAVFSAAERAALKDPMIQQMARLIDTVFLNMQDSSRIVRRKQAVCGRSAKAELQARVDLNARCSPIGSSNGTDSDSSL